MTQGFTALTANLWAMRVSIAVANLLTNLTARLRVTSDGRPNGKAFYGNVRPQPEPSQPAASNCSGQLSANARLRARW